MQALQRQVAVGQALIKNMPRRLAGKFSAAARHRKDARRRDRLARAPALHPDGVVVQENRRHQRQLQAMRDCQPVMTVHYTEGILLRCDRNSPTARAKDLRLHLHYPVESTSSVGIKHVGGGRQIFISANQIIAQHLARRCGAIWLRIDSMDQAIRASARAPKDLFDWSYRAAQAVAADNLVLGWDIIADCVSDCQEARDGWEMTGQRGGAQVIWLEIVCSDPVEHRRRIETRSSNIAGLVLPDWHAVVSRAYDDGTVNA